MHGGPSSLLPHAILASRRTHSASLAPEGYERKLALFVRACGHIAAPSGQQTAASAT